MGYQTDFTGSFEIEPRLTEEHQEFLVKLNETRRMARDVGPEFGTEGEWYVDGAGPYGQDHEPNILNYNAPPSPQPNFWCQWRPNDGGTELVWDEGEKFYDYVEWLKYLIENWFKPKGYKLNGRVSWMGEERTDMGRIDVHDNTITVSKAASVNWEVQG